MANRVLCDICNKHISLDDSATGKVVERQNGRRIVIDMDLCATHYEMYKSFRREFARKAKA